MRYAKIDMVLTGERIRCLCEQNGITVKEIQNYLELSYPQSIYRWFRGTALPTVDNLYALSELLGVEINELIVGKKRRKRTGTAGKAERFRFYYFRLKNQETK